MAASIAKLARAAVAAASRASLAGRRPVHPCLLPRLSVTGDAIRRMCSGAGTSYISSLDPPAFVSSDKRHQTENSCPKPEENSCPEPEENTRLPRNKDPKLTVLDPKLIESKEALYSLYAYWCEYYGISREPAEMRRRFVTFRSSAMLVHKTNKDGRDGPFLALHPWADMTLQETYPRPYYRVDKTEEEMYQRRRHYRAEI